MDHPGDVEALVNVDATVAIPADALARGGGRGDGGAAE
jgi:hypothetical protein